MIYPGQKTRIKFGSPLSPGHVPYFLPTDKIDDFVV
jgi:hypothetical protein